MKPTAALVFPLLVACAPAPAPTTAEARPPDPPAPAQTVRTPTCADRCRGFFHWVRALRVEKGCYGGCDTPTVVQDVTEEHDRLKSECACSDADLKLTLEPCP